MSALSSVFPTWDPFLSKARKIIRQTCDIESNIVLVGGGDGRLADIFFDSAPRGNHFLFEPHPLYRKKLEKRYVHYHCNVSAMMVSDEAIETTGTYILPLFVKAGKPGTQDRIEQVPTPVALATGVLDNLLPVGYTPTWIAINSDADVLKVITGAQKTIATARPHILFRKGVGDYGENRDALKNLYQMMAAKMLRLSTQERWLNNRPCFTEVEFVSWCKNNSDKALIVYP